MKAIVKPLFNLVSVQDWKHIIEAYNLNYVGILNGFYEMDDAQFEQFEQALNKHTYGDSL